jgi:hypothetical protein
MQIRLSLETEVEIIKSRGKLVDDIFIQCQIHHSTRSGKPVRSTWTLRALQVTAIGRLDGYAVWLPPMNYFVK